MNIFVLDERPSISAKYHTDKHVRKMIVESAQMLSTAHQIINGPNPKVYKVAYKNHPCTIWVRQSKSNYSWLYQLFENLLKEYTRRFNKHHKCEQLLQPLSVVPNIAKSELTSFALAMPEQYKSTNAVRSYREYYVNEKQHLFFWTDTEVPPFVLGK